MHLIFWIVWYHAMDFCGDECGKVISSPGLTGFVSGFAISEVEISWSFLRFLGSPGFNERTLRILRIWWMLPRDFLEIPKSHASLTSLIWLLIQTHPTFPHLIVPNNHNCPKISLNQKYDMDVWYLAGNPKNDRKF